MLNRRTDLPLERDAVSRFLPWLIAFMVYLSILALSGTLVLGALADRWDTGMSGSLTVQVPPFPAGGMEGRKEDDRRIQKVLEILRSAPGVERALLISEAKMMALLEPWLGTGGTAKELPLPYLIDVEVKSGATLDTESLIAEITKAVPDALLDDHKAWLERLIRLIRTVRALAVTIVVFIAMATIGTIIFATRTGLAIHQEVIEVLHLIGAQDSYVADQFARHAFSLGLRGGILGLLLAVPTLIGIGVLAERLEGTFLPFISMTPAHWAALGIVPAAACIIAMITARFTVTSSLSKML